MSGFKLAPSRLNRAAGSEEVASPARTTFAGLTASKLGLLAEPKLTPSTGAIQANTGNGEQQEARPSLPTPATFSFTPLSKPQQEEEKEKEKAEGKEKTPSKPATIPIFGERLEEKVTVVPAKEAKAKEEAVKEDEEAKTAADKEEEKSDFVASSLLFSTAAKASDENSLGKTLSESAAEYTETHSNKRKYDVVDTVTGEEAESNVLQAQVKLYIFDKEKRNWTERGRGLARLNDSSVSTPGHLQSRLVVRTSGNMRVVLNTKLWPDMICEKANEKSIRISALDEGEVKIFLISCSIKEAEKMLTALEYRINQLKANDEGGEDEEEEEERGAA